MGDPTVGGFASVRGADRGATPKGATMGSRGRGFERGSAVALAIDPNVGVGVLAHTQEVVEKRE